MVEFKQGEKVLVPGVVTSNVGLSDGLVRVDIATSAAKAYALIFLEGQVQKAPQELPTKVGSIVLLSDGLNELTLMGRDDWRVLEAEKRAYGDGFTSGWVEKAGFTVVWDRGAENGA